MRILIDIGHPAHVHLFKNLAWKLQDNGHKVLFTCRDREHVVYLLKTYGFVYENFGKHYKTMQGKLYGLAINEIKMLNTAMNFKPDFFISAGSSLAAHSSFLVKKPHITLEDTFNMEQVRLYYPFSKVVLTGNYPHPYLGDKELQFPGYHELAYLHPNVFTPKEDVLDFLGVSKGEKYAIVRFIAWNASHDKGQRGISAANKIRLVEALSSSSRVFISSESELPLELDQYRIKISPELMHDALAQAQLFIGEGATMAEEAAVLGTPSIYINTIGLGIIPDLVRYSLLDHFKGSEKDQQDAIDLALDYVRSDTVKEEKRNFRAAMLNDRIDVSSFLTWFIKNYPESKNEMRTQGFSFEGFK